MSQIGFPKITLKTDNEPAVLDLKRAAIRSAREKTTIEVVPEESNEYVSQTNGFVEQAVQAVERKVRTLKLSVEELHDVTLPSHHPLLVWALEYARQITNRSHTYRSEGGTAFELRRGKSYSRALPSVSEKATAMVHGKEKLKMTTEHLRQSSLVCLKGPIVMRNGAQKVSTVKRLSEAQMKDGGLVMALCGLPWRPKPDEPASDEVPVRVPQCHSETCRMCQDREPQMSRADVCTFVRKRTFKKYGYTDGCPGCSASATGSKAKGHSDECRRRIEEKMQAEKWKAEKG